MIDEKRAVIVGIAVPLDQACNAPGRGFPGSLGQLGEKPLSVNGRASRVGSNGRRVVRKEAWQNHQLCTGSRSVAPRLYRFFNRRIAMAGRLKGRDAKGCRTADLAGPLRW